MLHKYAVILAGVGAVVLLVQPSIARAQAVGPDVTITLSHHGNFTVGQPGIYTLVVSNIGGMATSGLMVNCRRSATFSSATARCPEQISARVRVETTRAASMSYPVAQSTTESTGGSGDLVLANHTELQLPRDKVNVNGGAVALEHPLAATRHAAAAGPAPRAEETSRLARSGTACIGGGQSYCDDRRSGLTVARTTDF